MMWSHHSSCENNKDVFSFYENYARDGGDGDDKVDDGGYGGDDSGDDDTQDSVVGKDTDLALHSLSLSSTTYLLCEF